MSRTENASSSDHAAAVALDLEQELQELRAGPAWERGKSAKRLTPFANFRITLFALKAGVSLGQHHNPGRVAIQTLHGLLRVTAGGELFEVPVGRMVVLDRLVPHDVEAVEESAFLVTISFEEGDQPK